MAHREQRPPDPERLQRNRDWVEWLARERHGRLQAVARHYGISAQDVDDVIQAALTSTMRSYPGPDEAGAVFSYAARAVQNTALKAHRRAQRKEGHNVGIDSENSDSDERSGRVRTLFDPSASDPVEQLIASEATEELRTKLQRLPDEQRAALFLSAAGYSPAEIARALGLSVRATRKRIEKGNRALGAE